MRHNMKPQTVPCQKDYHGCQKPHSFKILQENSPLHDISKNCTHLVKREWLLSKGCGETGGDIKVL